MIVRSRKLLHEVIK